MAFLCVLLLVYCLDGVTSQAVPGSSHATFLDPGKTFYLRWMFNDTHIEFEMSAKTLGWLAVGISPTGGMDQSDVLLGWVDDHTHRPVVQDRWNNAPPSIDGVNLMLDRQQDWMLLAGWQNNTHTMVHAVRRLVTCDTQDRPISTDTIRMIYATNPADPAGPTAIVKHTFRGGRSVMLLSDVFQTDSAVAVTSDPTSQQLDLLVSQVSVDAGARSMYHCSLIKLPPVDQKYHIVAIKPSITAGNEMIIHHLLAYVCNDNIGDAFPVKDFDCGYGTAGSALRYQLNSNCTTILGAFGLGSQTYYFPPEAGLPLTPDMGEKYVFLQIHYDNHNGAQVMDGSGISLMVTTNLRANDAAIMTTGSSDVNYKMIIPPRLDDFIVYGVCPQNCTSTNFPESGISVINVFLHTHLLGRKVYLRQIRNMQEMMPIAKDDNYDFNYQESQRLSTPKIVLPGDELIVECHYTSTGRGSVTFGGWGTEEEMCMAFVTYYPATPLTMCTSLTDTAALLKTTHYLSTKTAFPADQSLDPAAFKRYITSQYSWTRGNVAKLEKQYQSAPFMGYCLSSLSGIFYSTIAPVAFSPYTPVDACASKQVNYLNLTSSDQDGTDNLMGAHEGNSYPVVAQQAQTTAASTSQFDAPDNSDLHLEGDFSGSQSTTPVNGPDNSDLESDLGNSPRMMAAASTVSAVDYTTFLNSSASGMNSGDPVSAIFDLLKQKWQAFIAAVTDIVNGAKITPVQLQPQ